MSLLGRFVFSRNRTPITLGIYLLRPLRPVPRTATRSRTTAVIITVSRRRLLPRRQRIAADSTLHVGSVAPKRRLVRTKTLVNESVRHGEILAYAATSTI